MSYLLSLSVLSDFSHTHLPFLLTSPIIPFCPYLPSLVCQPADLPMLVRLNELCRAHNVSFFYAFTGGVHGAVFVDHGDDHKVFDFNGTHACVR